MMDKIIEHTYKFPPRCIKALNPTRIDALPTNVSDFPGAYFSISCSCGEKEVHASGYNRKSECYPEQEFFGHTVSIECPVCQQITRLFDSQEDGYNGEVDKQEGVCRAAEEGNLVRYETSCCGQTLLQFVVFFSYQIEDFEKIFAGMEGVNRPQDFFDCLALYGRCLSCGSWESVTNFECA